MNIIDIQACADFFQENYLKTFYLVITYNGNSFMLIGEKSNFPHLMGIQSNTYKSHGYNRPQYLFNDIIDRNPVSTDIFWKNSGPLTINFNPALSSTRLKNVDVLLTDINTGYILGWVSNNKIAVNANINMEKYCICTWIDESSGNQQGKEKYMPGQDVELIRFVFALDENSKLIRKKEYTYDRAQKKSILNSCARNNSNLLVDTMNAHYYTEIADADGIHCKINGVQY